MGNNPLNATDPTGMYCNAFNYGSGFCRRSQRFADIDRDGRISSKTTFFAAASVITEELGAMDNITAVAVTSPGVRSFLRDMSGALEQANNAMGDAIRNGNGFSGGSVLQNDRAFVRYEQGMVQGHLDGLRASDPELYDQVVEQSNATLNSSLGHSDAFNDVLNTVREDLGRDIDFANMDDRIAIGDAMTDAIRQDRSVTCTGSRIRRDSC